MAKYRLVIAGKTVQYHDNLTNVVCAVLNEHRDLVSKRDSQCKNIMYWSSLKDYESGAMPFAEATEVSSA